MPSYAKEPEKWEARAACLGHPDPDVFHPQSKYADIEPALRICRACPVVAECGETGEKFDLYGIWGGKLRKVWK